MSTLSEIAGNYDAILSDVWGVVHNGITAHPERCRRPAPLPAGRGQGGADHQRAAPVRADHRHARSLDVPRDAYDAIVSSGDVTRAMLAPYRGQTLHYVGPPHENDGAVRRSRHHARRAPRTPRR